MTNIATFIDLNFNYELKVWTSTNDFLEIEIIPYGESNKHWECAISLHMTRIAPYRRKCTIIII